jgi:hypothetical protein
MKSSKLPPELLVPGRRVTSNVDILAIEGVSEPETVDNPAVPANIDVARKARSRIERHRNGGGR